ncbi:Ulp1-like peptidase [Cucumis melo var. makuwa]|uniref:Ulp1-like peptidase n=1 Tax=Cucumis melo var. makuwa TaxID=1194695 RepID=A0A5D3C508_CUCMM|nr:Ulp1-like peptidase [Cucumis melo var. makuwa]
MLPKEKAKTCLEVEDAFKRCNFTTNEDTMKVAPTLFIEVALIGKDKKTQFDFEDISTWKEGCTYKLKRADNPKAIQFYNIKGYVLAFQVWACETLSSSSKFIENM